MRRACSLALALALALGVLVTTSPIATAASATGETSVTTTPRTTTRILIQKAPYRASLWRISARLLRDGDPTAHATLDLQVRLGGSWNSIKWKKRTSRNGWVSWHTTRDFPVAALDYLFRVHYAGDSSTRSSNSRTFRYGQRHASSRSR